MPCGQAEAARRGELLTRLPALLPGRVPRRVARGLVFAQPNVHQFRSHTDILPAPYDKTELSRTSTVDQHCIALVVDEGSTRTSRANGSSSDVSSRAVRPAPGQRQPSTQGGRPV